MNGDNPLDALFDELRQPATPSELAGESETVDAVVTAMMATKGSTMRSLSTSRRLRVASFVAAGIIGFGGVAAAGPSMLGNEAGDDESKAGESFEEPPVSVVETTLAPQASVAETTIESSVPEQPLVLGVTDSDIEVVDGSTTTEPLDPDPDTEFNEAFCVDGNHGKTVSSVARETPSVPGKGQIVSAAAHSSCGKDTKSDDTKSVDDDKSGDDDKLADDEFDDDKSVDVDKSDARTKSDKSDKSEKSGGRDKSTSGGQGNGSNGKSNGKGQSRDD